MTDPNSEQNQQEQDLTNQSQLDAVSREDVVALLHQAQCIYHEIGQINNHNLVKAYNSIPKLLWFHLLKGIAFGLGSVLGATVVLSMLVYILSQMEFIPIIGEWITAILEVVKQSTDAD